MNRSFDYGRNMYFNQQQIQRPGPPLPNQMYMSRQPVSQNPPVNYVKGKNNFYLFFLVNPQQAPQRMVRNDINTARLPHLTDRNDEMSFMRSNSAIISFNPNRILQNPPPIQNPQINANQNIPNNAVQNFASNFVRKIPNTNLGNYNNNVPNNARLQRQNLNQPFENKNEIVENLNRTVSYNYQKPYNTDPRMMVDPSKNLSVIYENESRLHTMNKMTNSKINTNPISKLAGLFNSLDNNPMININDNNSRLMQNNQVNMNQNNFQNSQYSNTQNK